MPCERGGNGAIALGYAGDNLSNAMRLQSRCACCIHWPTDGIVPITMASPCTCLSPARCFPVLTENKNWNGFAVPERENLVWGGVKNSPLRDSSLLKVRVSPLLRSGWPPQKMEEGLGGAASALKARGNAAFKDGAWASAVACYSQALEAGAQPAERAIILCNRWVVCRSMCVEHAATTPRELTA